jgi:hypothetical protein
VFTIRAILPESFRSALAYAAFVGRAIQIVIILAALVVAGLVVASLAKNLAGWIVFGVIVVTVIGAAIAIYPRRYTAKRRTFVRTTKPPR